MKSTWKWEIREMPSWPSRSERGSVNTGWAFLSRRVFQEEMPTVEGDASQAQKWFLFNKQQQLVVIYLTKIFVSQTFPGVCRMQKQGDFL